MDDINVNFDALGQGASSIQTTFQALQATLEDLEQQLQPMLGSWSGAAREAYAVQKQNWEQAATGMASVLQRMGLAVGDAQENYTLTENTNRNRFQ